MVLKNEVKLPVIGSENGASGGLTRREMVQRLLAGVGAGAAWPLVAASHPIFEHLKNDEVFVAAEKLGSTDWKPVFLSAEQNKSLIALAESIMPGSTKAQVSRFIDLLLSVDKAERQREFGESLAAFEAETQRRYGKNFPSLDEAQKNALLTDASAALPSSDVSGSRVDGDVKSPLQSEEKHTPLRKHFENLKGWVSGAYYSSELGMKELGWTGNYVYEKFPGCEHPEGHT